MQDKRFDFLGTHINVANPEATKLFVLDYDFSKPGYVSFPDSSVIAAASKNPGLQEILNNSTLTLPDGKPSEFYAKLRGFKGVSTVSGYWLSKSLFSSELTHYFLGGTPDKLQRIIDAVKFEFPDAKIVGCSSPPFYPALFFEQGNILEKELSEINRLKPDLIWIGISSPKQDFLMKHHVKYLEHGLMLGVGGVFDYLSGDVKKSPEWVKKIGMRWLWRLVREPRRLGSKYWGTFQVFSEILLKRMVSKPRTTVRRVQLKGSK